MIWGYPYFWEHPYYMPCFGRCFVQTLDLTSLQWGYWRWDPCFSEMIGQVLGNCRGVGLSEFWRTTVTKANRDPIWMPKSKCNSLCTQKHPNKNIYCIYIIYIFPPKLRCPLNTSGWKTTFSLGNGPFLGEMLGFWVVYQNNIIIINIRLWFQIFFIFTPTWGNDPIWLIFFKWVETTN